MDTNMEATSATTTALVGLASSSGFEDSLPLGNGAATLMNISEEDELKLLNFPPKQEELSTAIPLTVIFALLLVTGCIGNLCTAIVIARPKNKYMHTATNYYLFSLAMSDFLFLILGLPQEMYTLWQRYPYAFGECFCIIRSYFSEASTYASILTISAFTVERYVAICHPLWAHTMSQLPRAITSIVIIWIVSAICAIPPAAELGIVTQKGPITNRTLEESAQCASKNPIYENLFVVSAIVFFIVPMIIVTVLYILIAIELRRSSRMNNAISKQSSSQLMANSHNNNNNNSAHHHSFSFNSSTSSATRSAKAANLAAMQAAHLQHPVSCLCCCCYHLNEQRYFAATATGKPALVKSRSGYRLARLGNWNHWVSPARKQHKAPPTIGSCTLSPSSSLCLSTQIQVPIISQQQQQPSQPQNQSAETIPALDPPTSDQQSGRQSLMANIMSQRPSSAIGNERDQSEQTVIRTAAQQGPAAGHSRAGGKRYLWPLATFWLMGSPSAVVRSPPPAGALDAAGEDNSRTCSPIHKMPPMYLCQHCQLHQKPSSHNHTHNHHQHHLIAAHQTQSVSEAPVSPGVGGAGVGRPANHSPLSYHESLIERHHAANCNGSKQLIRPQHQLSLTHSSQSIAVAAAPAPASGRPHLNHHLHNNHHHQHHQHHQHGNHHQHHQASQQQQSRRSAAASSKKSVVRMLVAVVVSFFICWVPFHAQRLLASYLTKADNQNQFLLDIYHKLNYISGVTYYLSSTINPLLYQLMSAKFRLAFKETFNCSLFRVFSCCLSDHNAVRHSPTNSLKEPRGGTCDGSHHHTHHHHHHQHSGSCGGGKFRRIDSRASQLGSVAATGCECSAICSSDANQNQNNNNECPVDLSGCGSAAHNLASHNASMVARLRGRFKNSSLVSLFRASQENLAYQFGLAAPGANTCACCARHNVTLTQIRTSGSPDPLAVSTPLLAGERRYSRSPTTDNNNGGHFPAHSMLKFIRSPTPVVCGGQAASLTRLSSREDDDEDKNDVAAGKEAERKQTEDEEDALISQRMDNLIKATKDLDAEAEAEADSSEPNASLILTSGGESAGPSSSNSQRSSPEQQQLLAHPSIAKVAAGPAVRGHRRVKKLSSCSNSTGSTGTAGTGSQQAGRYAQQQQRPGIVTEAGGMPPVGAAARHRRRRSLQQQANNLLLQDKLLAKHERKSSLCSGGGDTNKQLSCSLTSSCDRHLDKKLSLSTTNTSAIGSYTTTNSQLTAAESANSTCADAWPDASRLHYSSQSSPPNNNNNNNNNDNNNNDSKDEIEDEEIIEQDSSTLIQDQEALNYDLLAANSELRRPLLEVGPTTATQPTTTASQKC